MKTIVHLLVRVLLTAVLLGVLAWRTDWGMVAGSFAGIRLELWLTAVAVLVATQLVSGVRWQWLARPLGFRQSTPEFVRYYFIGMYFNLMLPTSVGGDVIRAMYLDKRPGRRGPALLSVFVDRLSGLALLLLLAAGAAVFSPTPLPGWIHWTVWGAVGGIVTGGSALLAAAPWLDRFERLRSLRDSLGMYLADPALVAGTSALSLFVQGANIWVVWLVGHSLGVDVPASYYCVCVPMVTLLTLLPLTLNGMGVREYGMVLFLTPLGVHASTAVTLTFAWFAVTTVTALVGGIVYLGSRLPGSGPGVESPREVNDGSVRRRADQGRAGESRTAA